MASRAGVGEDAEDIVHDCLVGLLRAAPREPRAYAFGALYRRIALHWRQQRRRLVPIHGLAVEPCSPLPQNDAVVSALRLDGALEILAAEAICDRLVLRVPLAVAPAWGSAVAEAIHRLLDDAGSAHGISPRHGRRLRSRLARQLEDASERVFVSLEDGVGDCPGPGLWRGLHPDADADDLARRCAAARERLRRRRSAHP